MVPKDRYHKVACETCRRMSTDTRWMRLNDAPIFGEKNPGIYGVYLVEQRVPMLTEDLEYMEFHEMLKSNPPTTEVRIVSEREYEGLARRGADLGSFTTIKQLKRRELSRRRQLEAIKGEK